MIAVTHIDSDIADIYHNNEIHCHEIVFHKHESINYNVMKNEVINTICYLLNKKRY